MKYLLLFVLILAGGHAFAQVKEVKTKEIAIGSFRRGFAEMGWLKELIVEGDTSYVLRYQNTDYSEIIDIESIVFKGDKTVADLYQIMAEALKKDAGAQTTFTLGENLVMVSTTKAMGKKWITVRPGKGRGSFGLTVAELNKLFGRK